MFGNVPEIPIRDLMDEGCQPNLKTVPDPRVMLHQAHIILGVDTATNGEFLVYGKQFLRRAIRRNPTSKAKILKVALDQATQEFEQLVSLVKFVKGYHDYREGSPRTKNKSKWKTQDYYMLVRQGRVQRIEAMGDGKPMLAWPVAKTHGDAKRLCNHLGIPGISPAKIGSLDGETLEGHVAMAMEERCSAACCICGWKDDGEP
ncbi:MAG: hypothetical protein KDA84_18200, partial [Planctomycetaceae bacterium]|nr:hypothetical protein [Planctomycetaceae bacterium]